jgi:nicotinamide riboside kinase
VAAKIAFVGSHGVRKTTAAFSLAAALRHRGVATEVLHEVARSNPLGLNEAATAEAQLWILLSQVRRELELAPTTEVLVTDRSIVDNYAYALRAWGGSDRFAIELFVAAWARTYDLVVRLLPDVSLEPDGIRSLDPAFQSEIEALVDRLLPAFVAADRLRVLPASAIQAGVDWSAVVDALGLPAR